MRHRIAGPAIALIGIGLSIAILARLRSPSVAAVMSAAILFYLSYIVDRVRSTRKSIIRARYASIVGPERKVSP